MAGIMDFFKPAQQQQNQQQQQNNAPSNLPTPNGAPGQGGQQNPQGGQGSQNNQGGSNTPADPLDAYSKMWDTSAQKTPEAAPQFNIDPTVLNNVSGNMNFANEIPQDLMQRATTGDSQAMVEMMNLVARNAYKASLQHSAALTGKFVDTRQQYESSNLGTKVRGELTQNALSSIPQANHPVVKQQLRDTAERMQAQYPDASPQQIAEMAKKYIMDLASAFQPQGQGNQEQNGTQSGKVGSVNWDEFLGFDSQQ